ncbi:MAG: ABC transporter substrate-binding protein [Candidatus Limnocylindrales bacterium]
MLHSLRSSDSASPGTRMASFLLALLFVVAACTGGGTTTTSVAPATTAASPSPSILATSTPSETPVPAFPTTVTDDEGTAVTLKVEPHTIVSLAPATTETLFALGVGDRVKGKSQDVFVYPPQAGDVPDVASFESVDVEKIVALSPDVVFAGGNSFTAPDAIAKLRSLGLAVVVLYAPTVEAVYKDIELTGQAAGRSTEAAAIVERMRAGFDSVKAAVAGLPTPRVFYELDATGAIYGPADQSFLADMIERAGAIPVTSGSTEKYDISVERLIQEDPEVILLADAPYGVSAAQVAARPGWKVMTAVKTDAIRPIDDQTVSRPGPRLFLGLGLLAKTIHPDAAIPSAEPIPPVP